MSVGNEFRRSDVAGAGVALCPPNALKVRLHYTTGYTTGCAVQTPCQALSTAHRLLLASWGSCSAKAAIGKHVFTTRVQFGSVLVRNVTICIK